MRHFLGVDNMAVTKKHVLPDGKEISYRVHSDGESVIYEVGGNFFELSLSGDFEEMPTGRMLTEMYRFRPDDPADSPSSLTAPVVVSVWDKDTFVID